MPSDSRSAAEKDRHRREIAKLYFRMDGSKLTQTQIAEQLGISQATVSRDVSYLRSQWRREAKDQVKRGQGDALARYREIYGEAWRGYEESKTSSTETKGKEMGADMNVTTTNKNAGDPRFLSLALHAVDKEVDLLGLSQSMKSLPIDPMILIMLQAHGYSIKAIVEQFEQVARLALQQEETGAPLLIDNNQ